MGNLRLHRVEKKRDFCMAYLLVATLTFQQTLFFHPGYLVGVDHITLDLIVSILCLLSVSMKYGVTFFNGYLAEFVYHSAKNK